MATRFGHLQKVKPGDTKTSVTLDMKGYVPFTGRSGHLNAGSYGFKVTSAAWAAKKAGTGRNFEFSAVSTAPEGCGGVTLIRRQPAPTDEDEKRTGENMLRQLIWAIAAKAGKLEALEKAGPKAYAPAWFVGKEFCATVRDGEGEYADSSEFDRYITSEEFAAAPGPRETRESPRQDFVPDVPTGGRNGGRARVDVPSDADDAVSELLGDGSDANPDEDEAPF